MTKSKDNRPERAKLIKKLQFNKYPKRYKPTPNEIIEDLSPEAKREVDRVMRGL